MAKITEFHIGCSKLIALPNYQNIRIEASITVSMDDPNQSLADASGAAQQQLRQLLEETYTAQPTSNAKEQHMPSAMQLYNTGRWLNASDLQPLGKRLTAIVHLVEEAQVGQGNDQKTQLNLTLTSRQGQPWPKTLLLNKGNTLQMVAAFGDDYTYWTGKQIDIWSENVTFQGRVVPGIKVTASSNGNGKAVGTPNTPPNTPPPSATAVAGLPPNTAPNWQPPQRNTGTAIEDDEIPF